MFSPLGKFSRLHLLWAHENTDSYLTNNLSSKPAKHMKSCGREHPPFNKCFQLSGGKHGAENIQLYWDKIWGCLSKGWQHQMWLMLPNHWVRDSTCHYLDFFFYFFHIHSVLRNAFCLLHIWYWHMCIGLNEKWNIELKSNIFNIFFNEKALVSDYAVTRVKIASFNESGVQWFDVASSANLFVWCGFGEKCGHKHDWTTSITCNQSF